MAPLACNVISKDLATTAAQINSSCSSILGQIEAGSLTPPALTVGTHSEIWNTPSAEIAEVSSCLLGNIEHLKRLIQGPHEFLHDYVSTNWEYGAFYTVLEFGILDQIPLDSNISVDTLAKDVGIPVDKLLRVMRLVTCKGILAEPEDGIFSHTAISEEIVRDSHLKAFLGFQLFETRVASAYLSDALHAYPNDYGSGGKTGFVQAWGSEMYQWHAQRPEKAARFRQAMQGVSQSLDPGNELFHDWFTANSASSVRTNIVEIGGRYGYASARLAEHFPHFNFEVRDAQQESLDGAKASLTPLIQQRLTLTKSDEKFGVQPVADRDHIRAYLVRNVFWNWSDEDIVSLLRTFVPALESAPSEAVILICDGISPNRNAFPPHIELAYRRRDVTTMTMHNAKQRTEAEWRNVFHKANESFQIRTMTASSSHVFKGLWELSLA